MTRRFPGIGAALFATATLAASLSSASPATAAPRASAQEFCFQSSIQSNETKLYVSSEIGFGGAFKGLLRARAGSFGDWEHMALCTEDDGSYCLKPMVNGARLYVTAVLDGAVAMDARLQARGTACSTWEKFDITQLPGDHVFSIRFRANGKYVSAELGYSGDGYATLRARADVVGPWEQFVIRAL